MIDLKHLKDKDPSSFTNQGYNKQTKGRPAWEINNQR